MLCVFSLFPFEISWTRILILTHSSLAHFLFLFFMLLVALFQILPLEKPPAHVGNVLKSTEVLCFCSWVLFNSRCFSLSFLLFRTLLFPEMYLGHALKPTRGVCIIHILLPFKNCIIFSFWVICWVIYIIYTNSFKLF